MRKPHVQATAALSMVLPFRPGATLAYLSLAAGRGVSIIPENAELTTVQAAEVLNVSRPFLIKLLEDGSIPHRKVGKHRRVRMEDIMSYKAAIDSAREARARSAGGRSARAGHGLWIGMSPYTVLFDANS